MSYQGAANSQSRAASGGRPPLVPKPPVLNRDTPAPHPQKDPPPRSLTVNEMGTNQELLMPATFEIRRDATHSGARVDRVLTRARQHHDHVAGVAIHFDVSRHIAHPHVTVILMHHHSRVTWHMDCAIDGDAQRAFLRHGEDDLSRWQDRVRKVTTIG